MRLATRWSRHGLGLGVRALPCEFPKYPVVLTLNYRRSIPNPFQCSSWVRFVLAELCNHPDAFYWRAIFSFFPRESERRVLPIVGVCISASHLHTFSSSHLLIFTAARLHIFSSSHLLIFTSSHLHIFSSSHLLIFTSAHLHICSSSHLLIFTSSHVHIF